VWAIRRRHTHAPALGEAGAIDARGAVPCAAAVRAARLSTGPRLACSGDALAAAWLTAEIVRGAVRGASSRAVSTNAKVAVGFLVALQIGVAARFALPCGLALSVHAMRARALIAVAASAADVTALGDAGAVAARSARPRAVGVGLALVAARPLDARLVHAGIARASALRVVAANQTARCGAFPSDTQIAVRALVAIAVGTAVCTAFMALDTHTVEAVRAIAAGAIRVRAVVVPKRALAAAFGELFDCHQRQAVVQGA